MKKFNKVMALVLSVAVVLAMSVPMMAFAEDGDVPDPSITIQNSNQNISINGKTYSAYKLFDSKHSGDNYSYTMSTNNQFYSAKLVSGEDVAANSLEEVLRTYFDFTAISSDTSKVNVKPKDGFNESKAREFADKMQKFMTGKTATSSAEAASEKAVIDLTGANAGLGYYIVTGTATPKNDTDEIISAIILTNENPTPVVQPKADASSVDKKIEKIANGTDKVESDGKTGNGSVGDKVEYELTSKVPDMTGYKAYQFIYTDTMSKGLTFNDDIAITIGGTEYTGFTKEFSTNADGVTTITITFNNFIAQKDNAGKDIVIKYSATINEKAIQSTHEDNKVTLKYSRNPYDENSGTPDEVLGETPESKTEVYDTNVELTKIDASSKAALTGAKFKIEGNSSKVNVINQEIFKEDATTGTYYRLKDGTYTETASTEATADQYDGDTKYSKVTEITKNNAGDTYVAEAWVGTDGKLSFNGLGEGTYTITELISPEGYNPLPSPITVEVTFDNTSKAFTAKVNSENATVTNNVISFNVENNSGQELPSTGGIGTTIFYVLGAILVIGAGVLLVTRRRMNAN